MRNNKGFSLVELLVAFAILAIAGVAVFGLMQSSTSSFRKASNDVGLQYEQQIVVNQLRDVILESTNAAKYDSVNNILYTYSQKEPGKEGKPFEYIVTKIFLVKEETDGVKEEVGKLMWLSHSFDDQPDESTISDTFKDDEGDLLGENVKNIDYDLTKLEEGQITFEITFLKDEKEIVSKQIVTLRNKIINADDATKIFELSGPQVNSFITGITVYRDDATQTDGIIRFESPDSTDEVNKPDGKGVTIPYHYKVETNEYSTRDYQVVWKLTDVPDSYSELIKLSSDGELKIDEMVASSEDCGVYPVITCTSIDDPTKYRSIRITIKDHGVYPETVTISVDENAADDSKAGSRIYPVDAVIDYNIGPSADGVEGHPDGTTLCIWSVVSRDKETGKETIKNDYYNDGKLIVPVSENGNTLFIVAKTKQPGMDGKRVESNKIELNIEGIKGAGAVVKLQLATVATKDARRGEGAYVAAYWENADTSNVTYHWTIEPYTDATDKNLGTYNDSDPTRKFNDVFYFVDGQNKVVNNIDSEKGNRSTKVREYTTNFANSRVYVMADSRLDWTKQYKVKVTCYATHVNDKGKTVYYGLPDVNGKNPTDSPNPQSVILTYDPVRCILTPYDLYNGNKIDTSRILVNQKDSTSATRRFSVQFTGIKSDASRNWQSIFASDIKYTFFNSLGTDITKQISESFYRVESYNNGYIGFSVNVNPAQNGDEMRKANSAQIYFTFRDKDYSTNKVIASFLKADGKDIYNQDHLELMSTVRYSIPQEERNRGPRAYY